MTSKREAILRGRYLAGCALGEQLRGKNDARNRQVIDAMVEA